MDSAPGWWVAPTLLSPNRRAGWCRPQSAGRCRGGLRGGRRNAASKRRMRFSAPLPRWLAASEPVGALKRTPVFCARERRLVPSQIERKPRPPEDALHSPTLCLSGWCGIRPGTAGARPGWLSVARSVPCSSSSQTGSAVSGRSSCRWC